jgi:hypothetical protein
MQDKTWDKSWNVVNVDNTAYAFTKSNGGDTSTNNNPQLSLLKGCTYTFHVNAAGHPFYIKTAQVIGTASQFTNGVTGEGTETGDVTFAVPNDAPAPLYYQCGVHQAMTGLITALPAGVQAGGPSGSARVSTGAIIGITLAIVAAAAMILALVVMRRRSSMKARTPAQGQNAPVDVVV